MLVIVPVLSIFEMLQPVKLIEVESFDLRIFGRHTLENKQNYTSAAKDSKQQSSKGAKGCKGPEPPDLATRSGPILLMATTPETSSLLIKRGFVKKAGTY